MVEKRGKMTFTICSFYKEMEELTDEININNLWLQQEINGVQTWHKITSI